MLNLIAAISLLSASLSLAKPIEKREVGGVSGLERPAYSSV